MLPVLSLFLLILSGTRSFKLLSNPRPSSRLLPSKSERLGLTAAVVTFGVHPALSMRRKPCVAHGMTGIDSDGEKRSLLATIDDAGLSLKPRAETAIAKLALAETRGRKVKFLVQTCLLYTGFILYRAYRGFFVILPAVFRKVYQTLERAVDSAPFDNGDVPSTSVSRKSDNDENDDINPETGKVRWRTRVTVSILASIVTASYVVGGAIRVASRFTRNLLSTSNVSESLQAAAEEQEENETKIMRRLTINFETNGGKINGTTNDDKSDGKFSDLAP